MAATEGQPPHTAVKQPSDSKREREFYKYSHCVRSLNHALPGDVAASSNDVALTAFAQLVALRLNSRRAMVSLFSKQKQYILAEATRTLSLQEDNIHDHEDGLWLGKSIIDIQGGICPHTVRLPENKGSNASHASSAIVHIVNDMTQDERFSAMPYVMEEPKARFYAGVPIVTPSGVAIGSLCCLDDKVRDGLNDIEIKFLQDISTTIMAHLELARTTAEHARGISMVKGLSRFMEGKSDVEENVQQGSPNQRDILVLKRLNHIRVEAMNHTSNSSTSRQTPSGASRRTDALASSAAEERSIEARDSHKNESYVADHGELRKPQLARSPSASAKVTLSNDREAVFAANVRSTFARAASIAQEAMDLDGVLFLDASIGSFGGLRSSQAGTGVNHTMDTSTCSDSNISASDDAVRRSSGTTDRQASDQPKLCKVLGSCYRDSKDTPKEVVPRHLAPVTEDFLKSLLRRFPYGKVWNFDDEGTGSSDEFSDDSAGGSKTEDNSNPRLQLAADGTQSPTSRNSRKKRRRVSDGAAIQNLLPGVRSLAVVGLWDAHKERWFAGSIVWTYDPARVLSFRADLNYLGAFGDVIMAEIGRLAAQTEAKAKTTFISSISHELRSPLHGILGSVEYLQGKDAQEQREEMIHIIDVCGKTLLDIIDHLLDFTQINHLDGQSDRGRGIRSRGRHSNSREQSAKRNTDSMASLAAHIDLAKVTEEVVETAVWSKLGSYGNMGSKSDLTLKSNSPVEIILEVDNITEPWLFKVTAGAWRRLVLNLLTNALKYTDRGGYVKVKLSVEPCTGGDSPSYSNVTLTVTDSGRGMSQEFLVNSLFKPFRQEDDHAVGTGLGMNLVHAIVKDMGGKIEVASEKGRGTEVAVFLTLERAMSDSESVQHHLTASDFNVCQGLKAGLIGFDYSHASGNRAAQAARVLYTSIRNACTAFGMETQDQPLDADSDLFIISEKRVRSLRTEFGAASAPKELLARPCIILCHSIASLRDLASSGIPNVESITFVTQPLGPRKLAQALKRCIEALKQDRGANDFSPSIQYTSPSVSYPANELVGIPMRTPRSPPAARTSSICSGSRSRSGSVSAAGYLASLSGTPCTDGLSTSAESVGSIDFPFPRHSAAVEPHRVTSGEMPFKQGHEAVSGTAVDTGLSIMVVDDNSINLRLLTTYMKKAKHTYITATNGLESLNLYTASHTKPQTSHRNDADPEIPYPHPTPRAVNVILMDITMPVMDGFEATRCIRAHERANGIKPASIIALTALASASAQDEAHASGIDLFLTKPVKFKELTRVLAGVMEDLAVP
ncbi:hypothetical protein LTR66_001841 [Elasticomyces elasticus]|nr:hypothetical protein LTR66_001841 [Elasticomyces elasticus]